MPIQIPNDLPATGILQQENIFVMDEHRATHQDIRPIQIGLLNLMPLKEDTELQILRSLSNTPIQIDLIFVTVSSHESKNTSASHINKFYETFQDVKKRRFDGLIITGAPVEHLPFEEVDYWDEICEIMEWSKTHVTSTFHICWAAQAGLYQRFGIQKHLLPKKMFGIFPHSIAKPGLPLFKGLDSTIYVPHSRHTELWREDIVAEERIELLSESELSGVYIMQEKGTRDFFITGHSEYALYTLDGEYKRDVSKGLPIEPPLNYYRDDNPRNEPVNRWQATARLLFGNWLKYYCK